MTVRTEFNGSVALIIIDNPPVNATSRAVREGLVTALDAAEQSGVSRVVLTGAGKAFVSGADVNEFDAPPVEPHLPDIVSRIERFPVPVICAINGTALGGGLELALGCRMRIAAPTATLGLPEVIVGVVPGAGGTQRLPRLIGIADAVRLVSEGGSIRAGEALRLGMIDAVEADPVSAAQALPDDIVSGISAICDRAAPEPDDEAIAAARRSTQRRMRGQEAPDIAISLVAASASKALTEGLAEERATFLDRRGSAQAAALRHVFFAEHAARTQAERLPATPCDIDTAVVVGGGNMGAAIAYALAGLGITVTLVETDEAAAARARVNVAHLYADAVERGKTAPEASVIEQAARFSFLVGYDALPPAQIAIEAAFEDMEVKRRIFAALDAALPPDCVLATNTSYLDVNRIFERIRAPERTLGLHFFSPAHVMRLLEIVKSQATSTATISTAFRLAERMKKIPVQAGVCNGFIGNRILTRYRQTTDILMIEGATPWQVDAAMQGFGMTMGPYAVQDLSGLDIAYANRRRHGWKAKSGFSYFRIADRMVEELNRLGRKNGAGWYDYADDGTATPSAQVEALIEDTARSEGVIRRAITEQEIVARTLTAMAAEGLQILEEGISARPSDIDLVMIHGYGFPRWRGGLMHYTDRNDLPSLLARIEAYATKDPAAWVVPDILRELVDEQATLSSLN